MNFTNFLELKIRQNHVLFLLTRLVKRLILFIPRSYDIILNEQKNKQILGFRQWSKLVFYKIILILAEGKLRHDINERKHNIIRKFISTNYKVISTEDVPSITLNNHENCIWVFWWQGQNHFPAIIRTCYESIIQNSGGKKVILITKENFQIYVDIPDALINRVNEDKMLIAHLSDYVRFKLLYKYGGVWIDSTFFVTQNIGSNNEFNYDFYSIHYEHPLDDNCVALCRWVSSLLFAKAGNGIMYNIYIILEKYMLKYDNLIDYLFIDYLLDFLASNSETYNEVINNIPFNNENSMVLQKKLPYIYNEKDYCNIINNGTSYFKLTYKTKAKEFIGNKQTYYGYLVNQYNTDIKPYK
ncbi:MAG TPA: capsular polysaccharide synthesis protein [Thomasclavelia ramosa]|nr:capsular polysaccharide synthesis protein [Thomasclavelia ramosa]